LYQSVTVTESPGICPIIRAFDMVSAIAGTPKTAMINFMPKREVGEPLPVAKKHRRGWKNNDAAVVRRCLGERLFIIIGLVAQLDASELQSKSRRGTACRLPLILGYGVPEHSRRVDAWQSLRQKFDALFGKVQLLQV
jgi:hypothetical protein